MPRPPTAEDRKQAKQALANRASGRKVTQAQQRALDRVQAQVEAQLRKEHETIPQKTYCLWSGRPAKVLVEQAVRHTLPITGPEINLPAVIRALHDLLARHKHLFTSALDAALPEGTPERLRDEYVRWQIAEKQQKARLAELDVEEREGNLMPREEIHTGLGVIANSIRRIGLTMAADHGPIAGRTFNEGLDSVQRQIDRLFGPDPNPNDPDPHAATPGP